MCHEKPEPTLTAAEQLFFDPMPGMLPVYRTLRAKLFAAHPDMTVRTAKTQISFYNRRLFACVSLPRKKLLGTLDAALLSPSVSGPEGRRRASSARWSHIRAGGRTTFSWRTPTIWTTNCFAGSTRRTLSPWQNRTALCRGSKTAAEPREKRRIVCGARSVPLFSCAVRQRQRSVIGASHAAATRYPASRSAAR